MLDTEKNETRYYSKTNTMLCLRANHQYEYNTFTKLKINVLLGLNNVKSMFGPYCFMNVLHTFYMIYLF